MGDLSLPLRSLGLFGSVGVGVGVRRIGCSAEPGTRQDKTILTTITIKDSRRNETKTR